VSRRWKRNAIPRLMADETSPLIGFGLFWREDRDPRGIQACDKYVHTHVDMTSCLLR